ARSLERAEVALEQLSFARAPRVDVEHRGEVIRDIGGPPPAWRSLQLEPTRATVAVEIGVPRLRVSVDHARGVTLTEATGRLGDGDRVAQLRRDVGHAAVVQE